jgi:hypothetical protein
LTLIAEGFLVDSLDRVLYNRDIATQKGSKMLNAFNSLLRAKLVYNKKKEVYKIVAAFNVREQTENGAFKFPTKCDFNSGEFVYETFEKDKQRIIAEMQKQCRTNNIEFV